MATPETRVSLILRLPDASDADAWNEFVGLYRPVIFALLRRSGLQDQDADEVTQEVLLAVAGAVSRWQPDPERGRFRTWLACITRNLLINFLYRRRRRGWECGGSDLRELLEQQPDPAAAHEADWVRDEYRRCLFWTAAGSVRRRVRDSTWQAFFQSTVAGRCAADVAAELRIPVAAVYVARSRLVAQLKAEVQRLDALHEATSDPQAQRREELQR